MRTRKRILKEKEQIERTMKREIQISIDQEKAYQKTIADLNNQLKSLGREIPFEKTLDGKIAVAEIEAVEKINSLLVDLTIKTGIEYKKLVSVSDRAEEKPLVQGPTGKIVFNHDVKQAKLNCEKYFLQSRHQYREDFPWHAEEQLELRKSCYDFVRNLSLSHQRSPRSIALKIVKRALITRAGRNE